MSALNTQIAGEHYKKFVIQPIEFITINNLPFIEGNVIKYICRWKEKGGVDDLDKAINSSYGALYWSWLRIFDQFSSEERWVPPSGHVAGIFSRTAQNTEVWFAPAGLRRGIINTALTVEYNPTQSERDLL